MMCSTMKMQRYQPQERKYNMKCHKCGSPVIYDVIMIGLTDYAEDIRPETLTSTPHEYVMPSLVTVRECCSNESCEYYSGAVASDEKIYNYIPLTRKLRVRLSIHSETGEVTRIITNLPKKEEEDSNG